jgi:hypothetical protein
MSREQFDEALVDAFERELRDALAIEPSADFAQKVRARIAARRAPVVWWRVALPVAAMCVFAIGLGLWSRSTDEEKVSTSVRRAGLDVQLHAEDGVVPTGPVKRATTVSAAAVRGTGERESNTTRMVKRSSAEPAPEPEVIVPPDRALALRRFLEMARSGAVNEETLKPVAAAASPSVLEIEPIVVTPLSVPELEPQPGAAQAGVERE